MFLERDDSAKIRPGFFIVRGQQTHPLPSRLWSEIKGKGVEEKMKKSSDGGRERERRRETVVGVQKLWRMKGCVAPAANPAFILKC